MEILLIVAAAVLGLFAFLVFMQEAMRDQIVLDWEVAQVSQEFDWPPEPAKPWQGDGGGNLSAQMIWEYPDPRTP